MAWQTVTLADLKKMFSVPEWDALTKTDGQTAEVEGILHDTVAACRDMLRARNTIGPSGQLPDAARRFALLIARCDVLERWPKAGLLTEPRLKDKDTAYAYFAKATVTFPESDQVDTPAIPRPTIRATGARYNRHQEDGA
ncbi:MAG: hypothetical protein LBD14_01545 [Puniceicoccales bacterium]|jgi:hypothetical protein|nr:hypothetical protein [Puniceicoccales bacterium]